MKVCRFDADRLGLVEGSDIVDVSSVLGYLPTVRWPAPPGDLLIANLNELRPRIREAATSGERRPANDVRLLSPIANPLKIIGIGINYRDHAEEVTKDPTVAFGRSYDADEDVIRMFIKSSGAVVGAFEGVALRFLDRRNDHEVELGVVIGRRGTDIPTADALDYVAGYTIALDMSLRGPESASSRKAIDSYCVIGPWLATSDEIQEPDNLEISLAVNGEERQRSNTAVCRFKVARLVAHASTFCTLYSGDIIMTGTPAGVGPVKPGDVMQAGLEGVGEMTVGVRAH